MALFIGIIIILIVLFMVFAMALAEWADKDPGELLKGLVKKSNKEEKAIDQAVIKEEELSVIEGKQIIDGIKKKTVKKVIKKTGSIKPVKAVTKKLAKTTKSKKRTTK